MVADPAGKHDALATLATLLQTALDLTAQLARDAQLARLLQVFARFPPADRRPLVEKLETEVHARQRSLETGDGQVGPPNPLASLYVCIYENDRPLPPVTRDAMVRSTIQAMALMTSFPEAVRAEVEEAILAQMAALDPDDAEALGRHHEDLLALAAWCEQASECSAL